MNPIGYHETELPRRRGRIATSAWSDTLDELGIASVMDGISRRSGTGIFAGFAVTVRHTIGRVGIFIRADFVVGAMPAELGPGRILVVDAGGAEVSTFGGLAAANASRIQAAAVIIDGACRDIADVRDLGLSVASRHVTPITGRGRMKVESIGAPVTAGGVVIANGDMIVGDNATACAGCGAFIPSSRTAGPCCSGGASSGIINWT